MLDRCGSVTLSDTARCQAWCKVPSGFAQNVQLFPLTWRLSGSLCSQREKQEQEWFGDEDNWCLPIGTRIQENLDRSELQMASLDRQIGSDNVGFRMLQRMGWSEGKGLGRNEDGE